MLSSINFTWSILEDFDPYDPLNVLSLGFLHMNTAFASLKKSFYLFIIFSSLSLNEFLQYEI